VREQPGGCHHLLRPDAMDIITTWTSKKDTPIIDEIGELIRNTIGGADRHKHRNK
jgi:hypothetical protein